jgi:alkylation response protein AidB-like acyl-CoA dehydrogenase
VTTQFGDEERTALADSVNGLLDRRSDSTAVRRFTEGGGFDRDLWMEMAELGWPALLVPEEFEGAGAGLWATATVLEGLGRHTTPGPYLSSAVLAVTALAAASSTALRKQWLPGIAAGEVIGAVALAGTSGRAHVDLLPVVFHGGGGGGGHLDGVAPFVLDGADADVLVVGARGSDGPVIVAVPAAAARAERRPSIDRTRSLADLTFENVEVDADSVIAIGEDAATLLDRIVDVGAVAFAADAMGAARRAFDMTLEYAKQREQFGRPIGSFQAIKHKLADMYVLATGAEAAIKAAADSIDRGDASTRRRAAVAGLYGRRAAADVAGEAVQIHGGIGYTWEHDCHLLLKRTKLDLLLLSDTWTQGERLIVSVCSTGDMTADPTFDELEDPALAAFRAEVRLWLDENAPTSWQEWFKSASDDEKQAFLAEHRTRLHAAGYLVPHWPKEFGGSGLSSAEQLILKHELRGAGFPPAGSGIAFHHVAATLIRHGTAKQREALERILDGEVWCQGFSEPNAGSDLASLQTRAVRDGDVYIVNGQKIWSSGAQHAQWCLLLARTDPTAKKHKGISAFLVDMTLPGIDVRPIRQATGSSHFSEIFLTDVRVPVDLRVGSENEGWSIANTTLSTERGSMIIDNHARLERMLRAVCEEAARTPVGGGLMAIDDRGVRHELAERAAEVEVLGALAEQVVGLTLRHGEMGPEGSIIKLFFSEALQKLTELAIRVRGVASNLETGQDEFEESTDWMIEHIAAWMWTISAGSNEIQRNIIAERVLGLPREPAFN